MCLPYTECSERAQVALLRKPVLTLLRAHGLADATVSLAHHAFNTTFRVTTPNIDAALRVNVNSSKSLSNVRGEVALVNHILKTGLLNVPPPLPLFHGESVTSVRVPGFNEPLPVVVYRWVRGRRPQGRHGRSTGLAIGTGLRLAQQAADSLRELPPDADRPLFREVLMNEPHRLPGTPVFNEALARTNAFVSRLETEPRKLMHYDLHRGNLLVHKGQITVFDWDDSLWGWPVADAAVSVFHLRGWPKEDLLQKSFWEGLQSSPEALGVTKEEFEILVAGRALCLANALLGIATRGWVEQAPKHVRAIEKRLASYLRTGVYDPKVAKASDE